MILDQIIADRKIAVETLKQTMTISDFEEQIQACTIKHYSFKEALKNKEKPLNIIAEVKKASPSKGLICNDFRYIEIAKAYEEGGAAAISVLTEPKYFQGSNEYLTEIKEVVNLPVLRKDFIIDPIQIYEAKAIGADAILLIVAALSEKELGTYLEITQKLGLDALVETHNEKEVKTALTVGAEIIGVNNRDLQTFNVTLDTSERLRKLIPEDKIFVSESGIHTEEDIRRLKSLKVDAVLIGESIVKEKDPTRKIKNFITV